METVITNIASLEGTVLALDLEQRGFIVFVCVPNQATADIIQRWQRADIHSVIVPDLSNVRLQSLAVTTGRLFLLE